jgi:hypothetical protein
VAFFGKVDDREKGNLIPKQVPTATVRKVTEFSWTHANMEWGIMSIGS